MTSVTTQSPDILTTVVSIIKRKADHIKEGEALAKLELFYQQELKDIQNKLHRVNGEYITIESMEDDHLFNTIKQKLIRNRGNWNGINKKYVDEAKKRPALMERILQIDNNEIVPQVGYDYPDAEFFQV